MRSRRSELLAILMLAGCGSDSSGPSPLTSRMLEIVVVTTGVELDPDGYRLAIDGDLAELVQIQSLVRVDPGHSPVTVELLEVADNCAVAGKNPRTVEVPVGDTTRTELAVVCSATGTIVVTVPTTGADPTPYQYRVAVEDARFAAVEANGSVSLDRVGAGRRRVRLQGLPAHCTASGGALRDVDVTAGTEASAEFAVSCGAPPAGRFKLAFERRHSPTDQGDIYVMNDDGTGVLNLTRSPHDESAPAFSPDGGRIAFLRRAGGDHQLCVMAADGSDVRELTDIPGDKLRPVWSPDGTRIAVAGFQDIYLVDAAGAGAVNLTQRPGTYGPATWSPDGAALTFANDRAGGGDIYRMDIDAGTVVPLTQHAQEEAEPAWSPDGSRIAYLRTAGGCSYLACLLRWEVLLVRAAGGASMLLASPNTTMRGELQWSPDGRRLAYAGGEMVILDVETGGIRQVTAPVARFPAWAPDGRRVAATSNGEVFVVAADASGLTRLTTRLSPFAGQAPITEDLSPVWNPAP